MRTRTTGLIILLLSILLVSCGTTKIMVDQNINADIYVNGIKKGQNIIEIQRMGVPKKIEVSAKREGQVLGSILVKRKFDWATFLVGYFTDGIGFLTAWRFPEQVIIPSIRPEDDDFISPWDAPRKSVWMKPLNNTQN